MRTCSEDRHRDCNWSWFRIVLNMPVRNVLPYHLLELRSSVRIWEYYVGTALYVANEQRYHVLSQQERALRRRLYYGFGIWSSNLQPNYPSSNESAQHQARPFHPSVSTRSRLKPARHLESACWSLLLAGISWNCLNDPQEVRIEHKSIIQFFNS